MRRDIKDYGSAFGGKGSYHKGLSCALWAVEKEGFKGIRVVDKGAQGDAYKFNNSVS